ncbi:MAG: glycosyltransferase family 4 protein [Thermoproteota archaeon]
MDRLRILQIYEIGPRERSYSVEGVGSLALEISKRLVRQGHEVWFLTGAAPNTEREEDIDGVKVVREDLIGVMRVTWNPTNLRFVRQFLFPSIVMKRFGIFEGFDIYHGHIYSSGIIALALGRLWGGKVVTMVHGSYYPIWEEIVSRKIEAYAYRIAEKELATYLAKLGDAQIHTAGYFARMVESWGAPRRKIHIIQSGVDVERFSPRAKPSWRPSCCQYMLLSARRLVRKNGLEYLIMAMPIVRKRWKAHLVIAGGGPELERLRKLSVDLGVGEHVSFLGLLRNEEIPGLLSACDIAVVPSLIEAPGLFLLEAMATAKAVVASRVGSIPEVLDGKNGILVRAREPEEIAKAIDYLLSNPVEMRKMGQRARETVERKFTVEALTDRILSIYRSIR